MFCPPHRYGASCPEVLDVVRQFWMSAGDSDEGSEEGEGEDGRGEGLSAEEGGSMEELSEPMSLERPQAPRIVLRPNAKKYVRVEISSSPVYDTCVVPCK